MELQTIEMERPKAREAFAQYRRAVRERHDEEDAQIMRAYRELAKGTPLIRLSEAVRLGGTVELDVPWRRFDGVRHHEKLVLPRIVVVRADAQMVWSQGIDTHGRVEVLLKRPREIAPHNQRDRRAFGGFEPTEGWRSRWAKAIVPNVPPPLRPAHHLRNYEILFEAEWAVDPQPPVDPALLKHIGGDLYAVLAVWDLTPVEQAVLAGRAPDA